MCLRNRERRHQGQISVPALFRCSFLFWRNVGKKNTAPSFLYPRSKGTLRDPISTMGGCLYYWDILFSVEKNDSRPGVVDTRDYCGHQHLVFYFGLRNDGSTIPGNQRGAGGSFFSQTKYPKNQAIFVNLIHEPFRESY